MVHTLDQVDIAGNIPDFLERLRVIDIAILAPHHDRYGQRIAKIRVVCIGLNKGVTFRQQVRKYRA